MNKIFGEDNADMAYCFLNDINCFWKQWSLLRMLPIIVEGKRIAPQRCPHFNLQNLWILTLHGKRNFEDVIKLRALRWQDYPGLSACAQSNHMGPFLAVVRGRCDHEMAVGEALKPCLVALKTEAVSQASINWKRQKNRFSPRASRKEHGSADTLVSALWDPTQW